MHRTLAIWTLVVAVAWLVHPPSSSWHYFHDAGGLLVGQGSARSGPGGLHLWHSHPEFQFGPATVVVALFLRGLAGANDAWAARLLMAPLAPLMVWLLEDATLALRPPSEGAKVRRTALVAGLVLVPIWDWLALGSLHLDDALAMGCAGLAVWAVARRHPLVVAMALGVAANAKPWAVVFLPLVWAVPTGERRRAATIAVAVAVLPWVPFFIRAPGTLQALRSFRIPTMAVSALHVLDAGSRMTPGWDRPTQLVLGAGLAVLAVRQGRWAGALLVGVAVRLLLDPGAHLYYTASLVVAALIWDLLGSRKAVPWATVLTAAALQLPRLVGAPAAVSGWLRVLATVGAIVAVFAAPAPARPAAPEAVPVPAPRETMPA